ncbi:MAG: hypothetical protein IPL26_09765 [Leptospiraceae bacterium]|nr:hypothetical protein [Leptospiraceae bacterium]
MKTKKKTNQEILVYGYELLYKNLGPVDYTRFLQQIETGYGDYTKQRDGWLKKHSIDSIYSTLTAQKKRKAAV